MCRNLKHNKAPNKHRLKQPNADHITEVAKEEKIKIQQITYFLKLGNMMVNWAKNTKQTDIKIGCVT